MKKFKNINNSASKYERREHYNVNVIPAVIGCCGGGMKKFKSNIKDLFDEPTTTKQIGRASCRERV